MIEFKKEFSIPHFLFSLSDKDACEFRKSEAGAFAEKKSFESLSARFYLEYSGIHPAPAFAENEKAAVIVLGSPIYDDVKVDLPKTAVAFLKDFSAKTAIELIDGEFLAIYFDKLDGSVKIINDRWTSIPLFYFVSKEKRFFCASTQFTSIWKCLKANDILKIDQEAFFEFLWFQRLFGTKTFAKGVFFMPDAHLFELKNWKINLSRYWQRNYAKNKNTLESNARILADYVRWSLKMKTADGRQYGHFLSGGMDSRSVLAAFENSLPTCFTAGISDNREVRTARAIAEAKGARHLFLQLHPEHYGMIREAAVEICGGMFNYDHALFLGYNNVISKNAEVCFNGYGFDFMFQGMYIPGHNLKIGGRNLYLRFMSEPPDDLPSDFINNASYRIKDADIWKFVKKEQKARLEEFLSSEIGEIYSSGRELTDNKCDLWEYLTFHHVSRHYSYPNVMAIKTFAEARIISFTNEIFDFYLSLPVKQRFNGTIEKRMLEILNPKLAKIPSANTGLPVTASDWEQTAYQIIGAFKRRISGQKDWEEWTERTWPSREYALRRQNTLKNAAHEIISSGVFEKLDFLEAEKIKKEIPRWLEGEKIQGISGDLVQTLITIGTFLKIK